MAKEFKSLQGNGIIIAVASVVYLIYQNDLYETDMKARENPCDHDQTAVFVLESILLGDLGDNCKRFTRQQVTQILEHYSVEDLQKIMKKVEDGQWF